MRFSTLFIGRELRVLDKTDSTNQFAMELLRAPAPPSEGCVVWALEQQRGKGQRGKQWLSEPGANLTFSIILHPRFLPANEQFELTKAIALGIAKFVSGVLEEGIMSREQGISKDSVKIKWANDIYVHNSKIAGILIENILEGSFLKHSVVGIGLNVNQVKFDASLPNPTSLKREFEALKLNKYSPGFVLEDCLYMLCSFIEKYYLFLMNGNHRQLDEEYLQLLYKKGIWSKFMLHNEPFEGKIEGVNKQGHLLLKKKSGNEIEVTDIKQLVFL